MRPVISAALGASWGRAPSAEENCRLTMRPISSVRARSKPAKACAGVDERVPALTKRDGFFVKSSGVRCELGTVLDGSGQARPESSGMTFRNIQMTLDAGLEVGHRFRSSRMLQVIKSAAALAIDDTTALQAAEGSSEIPSPKEHILPTPPSAWMKFRSPGGPNCSPSI